MKLFVLVGDLCFLNIFRNLKTRKYFIFYFYFFVNYFIHLQRNNRKKFSSKLFFGVKLFCKSNAYAINLHFVLHLYNYKIIKLFES